MRAACSATLGEEESTLSMNDLAMLIVVGAIMTPVCMVVESWFRAKKNVERRKRDRAIAETKSATTLWNALDAQAREELLTNPYSESDAPDKRTREYLVSKHGDNIAAYDAWSPVQEHNKNRGVYGQVRQDRRHTIIMEAMAWDKERTKKP